MRNIIFLIIISVIAILSLGCATQEASKSVSAVEPQQQVALGEVVGMAGKKILMVVAPLNFRDEELLEPKAIFEQGGAEVTIASKDTDAATGIMGATVDVDVDISNVNVSKYDAVVFIGGAGATAYFNDTDAYKIAMDAYSEGKIVAAICIAPSILANAGVLKGHKATAFSSESSNIAAKSAGYTGRDVTVDGKIVTANGPAAAKSFGEEIVKLLR